MKIYNVAICIPTYKRPTGLDSLLCSISKLEFQKAINPDINIFIVDNDPLCSAKPIAQKYSSIINWSIYYEIENRRGIPFVRNKLVKLAQNREFIVFIDDDEIVVPRWLDVLITVHRLYKADIIMGPVQPKFQKTIPNWMRNSNFYGRKGPLATGDKINSIATNNLFIKTKLLTMFEKPFEEKMALTGATDYLLGMRLKKKGYSFIWANEAIVIEFVPNTRANIKWIFQRSFRRGNSRVLCYRYYKGHYYLVLKKLPQNLKFFLKGFIEFICFFKNGYPAFINGISYFLFAIGYIFGVFGLYYKEYK